MALDVTVTGVNVNASNQVKVVPETDVASNPGNVGAVRMISENDPGSITGSAYLAAPETSDDYRLRVGLDTMLDNDTFCYANQNTGKHFYTNTTMTMALSSNALTTNATSITTLNTGTTLRTWQFFTIFGQQTPLYIECSAAFSNSLTTNTTIDYGAFLNPTTTPYAPTDGVYFRATSAGVFGVINFNGVETTTSVFSFTPTANRVYQFLIAINEREVEFWIDDVLYGKLATQTGNGQPFASASLPFAVRHAIGGVAAGAVLQFKLYDYSVQLGDIANGVPFSTLMARMGGSIQVQPGATTGGQLSTYATGAAPGVVTLTSNTAPATNTLGGLFLLPVAIAITENDFPLFAWQNPAGTAAIPGRMFFCTGVRVSESYVTTALVGGPVILAWGIGFGCTASSLATTESTTFATTTTKIARKYPLGAQAFAATAAIGTIQPGFFVPLDPPIPINPGEFLHIILRTLGTATTGGAIRGGIFLNGYFK